MPAVSMYIIQVWYAVLVFKITSLVDNRLTVGLPRGLRTAEYLESAEKLRIFHRRYIVGILTNKANVSI